MTPPPAVPKSTPRTGKTAMTYQHIAERLRKVHPKQPVNRG